MDDGDRDGDARTFRANFSGEGAAMLRERVKEKLKEFMGDYTDDTLVEYVIVLLKNGRRKDEAMKELNVFLGDDSVSFVCWLWDHLSSNLHVYVQPKESIPEKATKAKPTLDVLSGKQSQEEHADENKRADSENEREKLNKASRSRRNREWKGLVQEISSVPIQKSFTGSSQHEGKNHQRKTITRRPHSPRPDISRKRIRQDEELSTKRESASFPVIDAPRRLLQFAVRDAVNPIQRSSSRVEPTVKRLRSVVSTSNMDSVLDERPRRKRAVGQVAGPVATALKAAAEAAEDVSKVRHSGSVFDRLDRSTSTKRIINRASDLENVPEVEYDDYDQIPGSNYSDFHGRRVYFGEFNGDTAMLDRNNEVASDSASDDDGFDCLGVSRSRDFDFSQSVSSASRDNKSLMVQYSVAQDVNEVLRKTKPANEDLPTSAASKGTSKIVNISVNVNTWKPPHYKECRDVTKGENQMAVDRSEASAAKPSLQVLKENVTAKTQNENEKTPKDAQKEPQKVSGSVAGSYASGRPEDVDSRTVFVSNVHFAATKDTLSRHFNKFGEVLKVIILTDAATSQPTGSAYVEFLRKESAELALSLNGTSFMSRILKVVRRSSAHPEAAAMIGWPRIARGSPYASRLSRGIPYARSVLPSVFRGRLPLKSGARSLQWRREASAQKGSQTASAAAGNTVLSPTGRNLTYVRPETKADASSAVV